MLVHHGVSAVISEVCFKHTFIFPTRTQQFCLHYPQERQKLQDQKITTRGDIKVTREDIQSICSCGWTFLLSGALSSAPKINHQLCRVRGCACECERGGRTGRHPGTTSGAARGTAVLERDGEESPFICCSAADSLTDWIKKAMPG